MTPQSTAGSSAVNWGLRWRPRGRGARRQAAVAAFVWWAYRPGSLSGRIGQVAPAAADIGRGGQHAGARIQDCQRLSPHMPIISGVVP
jgi:hypothetical protein